MKLMRNEEGVSPVIGVILMVAITVILAAVIAVFVFGLAGDLESSAQKEVTLTTGTSSDGEVLVTIFAGKDVSSLNKLTANPTGDEDSTSTTSIAIGTTWNTGFTSSAVPVTVVGTFNDGTEQVLARYT